MFNLYGVIILLILINSKMGLNLSRGQPVKYYSSDRIAQLLGNGLLTFVDIRTKFDHFFSNNQIVFYNDLNDLRIGDVK